MFLKYQKRVFMEKLKKNNNCGPYGENWTLLLVIHILCSRSEQLGNKSILKLCFALSWTEGRYSSPATDATQNMMEPSLTYDSGVTTLTFKRPSDTGDDKDWRFSEADSDCYYFMFPVGGGPHGDTSISQHSSTPAISAQKICISKEATATTIKLAR